ncbi:MAG: glycosyl hydrolase [Mucilaginibacter sp.]|nr:glycosyl hydrolase [Mucilaginibacter sp.]
MKIHKHVLMVILISILVLPGLATAQNKYFRKWPSGKSPLEIGNRVADHFIETPHPNFGSPKPPGSITYPETCAWFGALLFADASGNDALTKKLADRFTPFYGTESKLIPLPDMVDNTVFGAVPLQLYIQTKDRQYLETGIAFADKQWTLPANPKPGQEELANKGLSWQTRLWIDDMFMITTIQVQAYRATRDEKYINRAASEMVYYLENLQRPNGLFFHAPDVPFFWARGNGWMAAGMTEILNALPSNNPNRPAILAGYKKMMASLRDYQALDGMWRQLIDDKDAWEESSGTAMFTYALITGVKKGWLNENEYGPLARKAWLALTEKINANAEVEGVCEGTNKKNDRQYYLDREALTGDMHGQAPVLWCAQAILSK